MVSTLIMAGAFLAGTLLGAYSSIVFLTSFAPRGEFGQIDVPRPDLSA
jgi:hypothetical protein